MKSVDYARTQIESSRLYFVRFPWINHLVCIPQTTGGWGGVGGGDASGGGDGGDRVID